MATADEKRETVSQKFDASKNIQSTTDMQRREGQIMGGKREGKGRYSGRKGREG